MKKSVYLDSTIPSYFYDERESIKLHCDITRKWWEEESKNFDIYVLLETIAELDSGNYPRKNEILEFAREIEQLEPNPEIRNIVDSFSNSVGKIKKGFFLNRVDRSVVCNPWSVDNDSLNSKMVQ